MKLVLFGAGGQVAQRIAREALDRGHEVVGVARMRRPFDRTTSAWSSSKATRRILRASRRSRSDADVIINALSPRPSPSGRPATRSLPRRAL